MNKEKIIGKNNVLAAIDSANKYIKSFQTLYSFDPYDLLIGGSGFPDASAVEIALYNANLNFLDDILKAMEKRENVYNLNKNNNIFCTWERREAAL